MLGELKSGPELERVSVFWSFQSPFRALITQTGNRFFVSFIFTIAPKKINQSFGLEIVSSVCAIKSFFAHLFLLPVLRFLLQQSNQIFAQGINKNFIMFVFSVEKVSKLAIFETLFQKYFGVLALFKYGFFRFNPLNYSVNYA